MKLKLEAEWRCSGTGKSSRLPAAASVCVCDEEGSARTFLFWGATAAQKKKNFKCKIPPKTHRQTERRSHGYSTVGQSSGPRQEEQPIFSRVDSPAAAWIRRDLTPDWPQPRGTAPVPGAHRGPTPGGGRRPPPRDALSSFQI